MCIVCSEAPARREKVYMHSCKACIAKVDPDLHYKMVEEESILHLAKAEEEQTWEGTEPPLQLLLLPEPSSPLKQYADEPHYLHPSHCRLCLQPVDPSQLEEHLKQEHGQTLWEYRRHVLARTLAEWPQPISPQVCRTRVAAFVDELCDSNFRQRPCAVCAREKRECKLRRVTFPPRDAAAPPEWLPWAAAHWHTGREGWYDRVDDLLNIDSYLRIIFEVDQKLEEAAAEVATLRSGGAPREGGFTIVEAAEAWEKRVQQWARNMRDALHTDSVEAPGLHEGRRWLLYQSPSLETSDGHVTCFLCRKCSTNLAASDSHGRPAPRLPAEARANGLWRGPDPPELSSLSYTEAKVINLARIYVSVKRVFLNSSSYARTSASEAPFYHSRNVVAFPHSVDKTLTSLGTPPQVLADHVVVQFVGEDRDALRQHPELSVSTHKLRDAFFWVSQNSWPFMEATKHHELWDQKGTLAPVLEDLLQAYETSVGTSGVGTPKELLERAVRVASERATVHRAGPADCTAWEDGTEPDEAAAGAADNDDDGTCAAAIHGGADDMFLPFSYGASSCRTMI